MNELVAILSVTIVVALGAYAALTYMGPVAFAILCCLLGFFGLMAACAKFWTT